MFKKLFEKKKKLNKKDMLCLSKKIKKKSFKKTIKY